MMSDDAPAPALSRTLQEAYDAFDAENYVRAGELLAAAAPSLAPDLAKPTWFDAALCALFVRNWPRARELGRQAVRFVERAAGEPAYWNLGTAATALRDWDLARDCWVGFGMPPLPGSGPVDIDGGPTCVRLSVGEVVWATRIDPVRARVRNVPFDPSRRFGEIILHGGAQTGERVMGDAAYPVFDEIELFEPSDLATLSVVVTAPDAEDLEALADQFADQGYGMEILNSRVDRCTCCSGGSHRVERGRFSGEQPLFVAAPESEARTLLEAWSGERPASRSWTGLHPA
jgi:hypothetical protein